MTDTTIPQPKSGVMDIDMYVPGKSKVPSGVTLHKLSSNESPIGPSPNAVAAIADATAKMEDYPDGSSTKLRNSIAEVHGLNSDNIICGNGSDEILGLLANTYLSNGDEAIFTEHGFLVYRIATLAAGATPVVVKEDNCKADVDTILEAVTPRTKLVFLANPNNPTGTYLPIEEIKRLHSGLLMTRTFSKIYGLAALRIGWAYGPRHMIDALNRVRGPFNVNAAAIAAGTAAMKDKAHLEQSIAHNDEWLVKVTDALEALGLTVTPSVGNFVLAHFPEVEGKTAAEADAYLTQRGFVMRAVTGYGFPNALRMTIGSAEANQGALAALKEFMS